MKRKLGSSILHWIKMSTHYTCYFFHGFCMSFKHLKFKLETIKIRQNKTLKSDILNLLRDIIKGVLLVSVNLS